MKVFPKAPKLSAGAATLARQDTIDEGGEGDQLSVVVSNRERTSIQIEQRPLLERQPTERDRLLDSAALQREREKVERSLTLERERQIEMASSRATTSDTYDTGIRELPITLAQRDLIATVLDMKVDVRLEMQRMSQRIGRLEDLLTELIKRISNPTQPSTGVDSSGQSTPGDDITTGGIGDIPTVTATVASATASTSTGGNGLGPILLRKRRSKSRKAPAPPKTSPEQTLLLEPDVPLPPLPPSQSSTSSTSAAAGSTTRKREFL